MSPGASEATIAPANGTPIVFIEASIRSRSVLDSATSLCAAGSARRTSR
jgi:hypothetical protein